MKILNGKILADKIKDEVKGSVEKMTVKPCLAVIQVGEDPASSTYVRNKEKACQYCGIESEIYRFSDKVSQEFVLNLIKQLNNDDSVTGILVQLPLPEHLNEDEILQAIDPDKDVDGFHEINVGKLMIGKETFVPCTAKGIIELLKAYDIPIEGQNCVVVGRSNIVGKPIAMELMRHNGTVTICHSKTKDLDLICKKADILVCAIGKPKFFDWTYTNPGMTVIDVGIHRQEDGTLCGDVYFDDVRDMIYAITPVPKGVGPMTVAMLMKNCVQAARRKYE